MKKIINIKSAPEALGAYSQAISAGGFLFLSGQLGINPETNELIVASIEDECKQALENISAILKSEGLTFQHVVKSTIYLQNMGDFSRVNDVYSKYFVDNFPARSCVEVSKLPKGANVEIEVICYIKQ